MKETLDGAIKDIAELKEDIATKKAIDDLDTRVAEVEKALKITIGLACAAIIAAAYCLFFK